MKEEITWNTICPVCGMPIREEMPPMELAHLIEGHNIPDRPHPGLRICSKECAAIAVRSPEKYFAAAKANRIAA
ncbi:MAG: hypothetical protein ABIY55_15115 [Kofleriaceae bacterium]